MLMVKYFLFIETTQCILWLKSPIYSSIFSLPSTIFKGEGNCYLTLLNNLDCYLTKTLAFEFLLLFQMNIYFKWCSFLKITTLPEKKTSVIFWIKMNCKEKGKQMEKNIWYMYIYENHLWLSLMIISDYENHLWLYWYMVVLVDFSLIMARFGLLW